MILLLSIIFCSCNAQNNLISSGIGSAISQASSSALAGTSFSQSAGSSSLAASSSLAGSSSLAESSSSAGSSSLAESSSSAIGSSSFMGSSSSAASFSSQSTATVLGSPGYASCVQSDNAVRSRSIFSYNLLESTFTNPALKGFYDTSFDATDFYQVIYDELKATWFNNARKIAGSLSLLFEKVFPRLSPLVNAVSITNAISEFLAQKVVITTEEFDDYVDAFINAVSKGLRNEDGSPKSNAKAIVTALMNFLANQGALSYSSLHEFISILAGNYRLALYSNCLPSSFEEIPKL